MEFVPRRVARKGLQKSTTKHIPTIPAGTSDPSTSTTSTSTSLSPTTSNKGKSKETSYASEEHLLANALVYLLSPVYLAHRENAELRQSLTDLEKGIQEQGETYLHLSRLLSNPIVSVLCPNVAELHAALKELEPLGFLELSPSGFGVKLSDATLKEMLLGNSTENQDSRLESRTIYIEDLPTDLSTSLAVARYLKSFTCLSVLSVIPSISPLERFENLGQGLSAISSSSHSSSGSHQAEASGKPPSFISSSNLVALNPTSTERPRYASSIAQSTSKSTDELDWSINRSNLSTSSSSSKSWLNRRRLFDEVSARRPKGARALITFGFSSKVLSSKSEEPFIYENMEREFEIELKKLMARAPWKDENGKSLLPFKCLDFQTYRSLAKEYVRYKNQLHKSGWKMSYPSVSNTATRNSRPSQPEEGPEAGEYIEEDVASGPATGLQGQSDMQKHEILSRLTIVPSESELKDRPYPHSTIVRVNYEFTKPKEEIKQKNPKVSMQVEADRLIQKQLETMSLGRAAQNGRTKGEGKENDKEKEKEKAVDYVDWKEGDDFVHFRISTSYHAALLVKAIQDSSSLTSEKVPTVTFSHPSILEGSAQEEYWSSLPAAVRKSSKKREVKVWNLLRGASISDVDVETKAERSERAEGEESVNGGNGKEEKAGNKRKKGKKRKLRDNKDGGLEDGNPRAEKHIRFD